MINKEKIKPGLFLFFVGTFGLYVTSQIPLMRGGILIGFISILIIVISVLIIFEPKEEQ